MKKHWVTKQRGDNSIINKLADELNVNNHIANLLVQRGIKTSAEAQSFFNPTLSDLHDPFLMKDMLLAVKRIELAAKNNEKILVYGDYDVDGTTAIALVYTFLKKLGMQVGYYVPDRYQEGYGVSYNGVKYAADNGFTLIISLDCGIKAVEEVKFALSKNIDFIICDHHIPGNELPPAVAILDPKTPDSSYPYDDLSGCGVGFKLIQAYSKYINLPFNELVQYLDLVAVSIASDIVNITGENRILAYYGLKLINSKPRPGIESILKYSKIIRNIECVDEKNDNNLFFNRELTINDIVFLIGPRINSTGRIENAYNSIKLLICDNEEEALKIGKYIDDTNTERKNLDTLITAQAIEMINSDETLRKSKSTVLYNPDWHKGVVGIVASRVLESFYRPTIILTRSNDLVCGSARSIKDFDIYNAIDACGEYLEHFGGHKYAAGLSLKYENLEAFRKKFEETVSAQIEDYMLVPEIEIDDSLFINDITLNFYNLIKKFAPFGPGNMSPVFKSHKVIDTGYAKIVGNNHLKLNLIHPHHRGFPVPAIAFHQGDHINDILAGKEFDVCYHIDLNKWNDKFFLQLNIKDIKFCEE